MITIAGHSAGAADVGFHVISPLSKGTERTFINLVICFTKLIPKPKATNVVYDML